MALPPSSLCSSKATTVAANLLLLGKMPSPGRLKTLLLQPLRLAHHLRERRPARRLLRLVPHLRRLLLPRRRQIRFLRDLQEPVRREMVPQCQQNGRLPWSLGLRRIVGRPGPVSVRGRQSQDADDRAAVCIYVAGRVE